jgi:hypothetical protein
LAFLKLIHGRKWTSDTRNRENDNAEGDNGTIAVTGATTSRRKKMQGQKEISIVTF